MNDLRIELDELRRRKALVEQREKQRDIEVEKFVNMSFRERVESDKETYKRVRGSHEEAMRKHYKINPEDFDSIFNEYFNLVLDRRVKNMIEFCTVKGIERKPDKKKEEYGDST